MYIHEIVPSKPSFNYLIKALGICSGVLTLHTLGINRGALIIRTGSWGPLYYDSNKEPPEIV